MGLTRRDFLSTMGYGVAGFGFGSNILLSFTKRFAEAATQAPVKVGLLAPTSGVFADFGKLMSQSANLAVEIINGQGGILGRDIQIVQEDDQGDPAIAGERARKLLTSDGVDILLGTVSSATTLAVLPHVNQARKVYFYPLDGEDKTCVPGGGTNPLVFGLGDTPQQRLSKFVPFMVKKFGAKWYFIGNDYVFPRSVNAVAITFLKEAGGSIVREEYTPLGTADYLPIVRKIKGSGANVVFSTTVGTDGVSFTKQARESGLFDSMTVTGVATFAPEVYSGLAQYAEGVITADRYTELVDNAANRRFVAAFKKKYNYPFPLGGTAAAVYGSFLIMKQAASKAGTLSPAPFARALEGLQMELPQGQVEIDKSNHLLKQHIYLLHIHNNRYEIMEDFGLLTHPDHDGCSVK